MIALIFACLMLVGEFICRIADRRAAFWRARVWWEGDWYVHRATSLSDGLSWAACYPHDAYVHVECVRRGQVVSKSSRAPQS